MKQGRGDESEAAELMCVEEGGKRRHLSKLTLPNCGTIPFELKEHSRFSESFVVTDKALTCHWTGAQVGCKSGTDL